MESVIEPTVAEWLIMITNESTQMTVLLREGDKQGRHDFYYEYRVSVQATEILDAQSF